MKTKYLEAKLSRRLKPVCGFVLLILIGISASRLHGAALSLSPVPLILGGGVEANVMFTLDDSGSMHWEYMPDDNWTYFVYPRASNVYGSSDYGNYTPVFSRTHSYSVRVRSPDINKLYYNPEVTYLPWATDSGGSYGNVSITCAPHNPLRSAVGCRDLTNNNSEYSRWESYNGNASGFPGGVSTSGSTKTFWPAVYYRFNGGDDWNASNYTEVLITPTVSTYTGGGNRSDCSAAPTCSYAEEVQNFANWYSYYRSRVLTARGGVGRAFAAQGENLRVGFAAINQGSTTVDGVGTSGAIVRGVRPFNGSDRTQFFTDLYDRDIPTSSTPLRRAVRSVGGYFERSDDKGPWAKTPGTTDSSAHLTCRQSFHILMTDGYYNGYTTSVGNVDNAAGSAISGPSPGSGQPGQSYTYSPQNPYMDGHSDTLADYAMEYWKRDLRPALGNEVPTNTADPAFWQHLVTYTVGLGVSGTLDPAADLPALSSGTLSWPDPSSGNPQKIDDMWHAAVNSRGEFFSATDPTQFADSLGRILASIANRVGSAASVALNSGSISTDSLMYQARFDSGDWSGQLLALPIKADGSLGTQKWDAASKIPAHASRVIVTHDGQTGQAFQWGSLSAAQQIALGTSDVLHYLRGDQTLESNAGGTFRNRKSLLGDIVNSAPAFSGENDFNYPDNWNGATSEPEDASPYSNFVAGLKTNSRTPLVFAGANDGMLHAFNAATGAEVFAYVPNVLYDDLSHLSDPLYTHQYFVDGSPTVVDAFINGAWKTVLVGTLGGGGQGLFAIDVTDPGGFSSESTAKAKVLWEFSDRDTNGASATNSNFDADLGYVYGQANIVRLHNGKWAAVFGNGYNNIVDNAGDGSAGDSSSGNAVLYIVDLANGNLIKKLDTGKGTADDPSGLGRPNGLAEPATVDADGDSIVDYVYAGDLQGNLWKFDLSDPSPANWAIAHSKPFFKACAGTTCTSSNYQPITVRPRVGRHPTKGMMVYFGTGKYLETGDNATTGQTDQSFYGLWDENTTNFVSISRSNLLEQTIFKEVVQFSQELRASTTDPIDWTTHKGWFMDLYNHESGNTNNYGERQVSTAILRSGRIIFTTLIPDPDPCTGGTGWLMELDAVNGGRLPYTPFDLNADGLFDDKDYINVGDLDGDGQDDYVPASGKKSKVGVIPTPGIITSADGKFEYKYTSGSTAQIEITNENPGSSKPSRRSWLYLEN